MLSLKNKLVTMIPAKQSTAVHSNKTVEPGKPFKIPLPEWKNYEGKASAYRSSGRSDLALKETKHLLEKYPDTPQIFVRLVLYFRESGNYDLALDYARKALGSGELDRGTRACMHLELLYIYRAEKKWALARQEIDRVLEESELIQDIFPELKAICSATGLDFNHELKKVRKLIQKVHGESSAEVLDRLVYLDQHQAERQKQFESDLSESVRLAHNNNIRLILMTYPGPLPENTIIREAARKHNTILIDNEAVFDRAPEKAGLFVGDGHCNEKGYKLIAANIYSVLSKNGVLNESK